MKEELPAAARPRVGFNEPKKMVHERAQEDGSITLTQLRKRATMKRAPTVFTREGHALVSQGATVTVISESEDWAYVKTEDGDVGYMQMKHLRNHPKGEYNEDAEEEADKAAAEDTLKQFMEESLAPEGTKTYLHQRKDGMTITQMRRCPTKSRKSYHFLRKGKAVIVNGARVTVLQETDEWAYVKNVEGDIGFVKRMHLCDDTARSLMQEVTNDVSTTRFIEVADADEVMRILSTVQPQQQSVQALDFILPLIVVFARVAKPLANGIALAGRSDYPFSAPTAQCIGLLLTSGIFLCLSSRHSEFYERKTFEDKSTLAKSFVVGSLAGIGDVCEMLANQYAGVALTAVLLVASRVVITAVMSRVLLKKEIPEIQIWCLLIVVISIMAFGLATSQDKSVSLDRLLVGLGFVFVSASLLSSQSIVKELVAGTPAKAADGSSRPTTNFHENMVCLFAGAGFSSFLLAMYELRCNIIHFFNGWELRTIPIPMSICLMAVLSSLFTKYFGALTTVLIAVLSVVLVFFSSVVLFGQPMPPLVLVLLMLVAVSVMVAARAGFISKDFAAKISQQADVLQMAKGSLEKRMQVLPSQLSESWLSASGRNSASSMSSLDSLEEPLLKAQGALA